MPVYRAAHQMKYHNVYISNITRLPCEAMSIAIFTINWETTASTLTEPGSSRVVFDQLYLGSNCVSVAPP